MLAKRKVLLMRFALLITSMLSVAWPLSVVHAETPHVTAHVDVYNQPGRFAGWPANNGIWNWDDEIVVGFTLGYHKEQSGHTIDGARPQGSMQARSRDGGRTWEIETPAFIVADGKERETTTLTRAVDFTAADFAVRFRGNRFYYSLDRCVTWEGPFTLPAFDRPSLLARTDYIIEGQHRLTAFIAAAKDAGNEGRPLCIRTTDGGVTWDLVGWIGPSPPAGYGYAIMPATVSLERAGALEGEGSAYLSIIRRGGVFDGEKRWWLESFVSPDDGHSWYMLERPRINNAGNPATLTRLEDGRIAMAYGWRHAPYGIRSRISDDEGQTWSSEIILRSDGNSWDLGYPRTVQRADGQLVTAYYFNDASQPERYIAATIWNPGDLSE
jgi:hypothetical protein